MLAAGGLFAYEAKAMVLLATGTSPPPLWLIIGALVLAYIYLRVLFSKE